MHVVAAHVIIAGTETVKGTETKICKSSWFNAPLIHRRIARKIFVRFSVDRSRLAVSCAGMVFPFSASSGIVILGEGRRCALT